MVSSGETPIARLLALASRGESTATGILRSLAGRPVSGTGVDLDTLLPEVARQGKLSGESTERLLLIQRTLERALSRLSDAGGVIGRGEGRRPAGQPGQVGELPGQKPTEQESVALEVVTPAPGTQRLPGVPTAPADLGFSLVAPSGPDRGSLEASLAQALSRSAGDATGPMYKAAMPLVAPAVSAVAASAMMARREEARPAAQATGPKPSETSQDAKAGDAVDLDALAVEMADRILRRMKRDKERRGFYG